MDKLEKYDTAILMKSQGFSYDEISEKTGVPKRTLYDWCAGKRKRENLKDRGSKVSDKEFIKIVSESFSISECLEKQGLKHAGANYKGFHSRVKRLKLDTSHFLGQGHMKGKTHNWSKEKSIEEVFIENGSSQTSVVRRKVIKHNLLEYKCAECNISTWREKDLALHLDHINGINNDHRLENLRFLCPNCHSQTETYCGKNKGKLAGSELN